MEKGLRARILVIHDEKLGPGACYRLKIQDQTMTMVKIRRIVFQEVSQISHLQMLPFHHTAKNRAYSTLVDY